MQLGIAWKVKAKACGGFGAATRRELERLARSLDEEGHSPRPE
jgi:hypothetical protein